jgi:hypothetical protein
LSEASWGPTVAPCRLSGVRRHACQPTIGSCLLNRARRHAVRSFLGPCSRSLPPQLRSPTRCQKRCGSLQSRSATSMALADARGSLQSGSASSVALGDTLSGACWEPTIAPCVLNCARRHAARSVLGAYSRFLPPHWLSLSRAGAYNRDLRPQLRSLARCQGLPVGLQSLPAASIALVDTLLEAFWEPAVGLCLVNCAHRHAVTNFLGAYNRSLPTQLRSLTRCQKRPGSPQLLPATSLGLADTRGSLQSGSASSNALADALSGPSCEPTVAPGLLNCARRHAVRSVLGGYNRFLPPQWRSLTRVGAYNRALPPQLRSATRFQELPGSLQSLPASSIALADTLSEASWEPAIASCHLTGAHCRA